MSGFDTFDAAYDAVLARWPVPTEALDVPTGFGVTRVHACGPADGRPLVLLHGGGATSTVWFANAEALHRRHRLFAVDIMGDAGRSVPVDGRLRTVEDLMSWLGEVLDRLGLSSTDLCGHSYGAKVALEYALRTPDRVRRLALLDPTLCFAGMSPRYLLHALPLLARPSGRRLRRFYAWESATAEPIDPGWLALAAEAAEPVGRPGKLVVPRRPRRARLRHLEVDTLVVLAGRSRAHRIDRVAAGARRSPSVTVVTVPDVSHHGMPIGQAGRINEALLAFLR